jgi:hypothetical protein
MLMAIYDYFKVLPNKEFEIDEKGTLKQSV